MDARQRVTGPDAQSRSHVTRLPWCVLQSGAGSQEREGLCVCINWHGGEGCSSELSPAGVLCTSPQQTCSPLRKAFSEILTVCFMHVCMGAPPVLGDTPVCSGPLMLGLRNCCSSRWSRSPAMLDGQGELLDLPPGLQ